MLTECNAHSKPVFGCRDCITEAQSEHRTYVFRNGRQQVSKTKATWHCPKCGKTNEYGRLVCVGTGATKKTLNRCLVVVYCGYDRRFGQVTDRLLQMVERTKMGGRRL